MLENSKAGLLLTCPELTGNKNFHGMRTFSHIILKITVMIYDYIILWQGQMKRAIRLCLLCFFSNNTSFINLIFSMISKMVPTKGTKNQQYLFGWIGSKWGRVKFRHRRVQKSKQNRNITPNMWNEIIHLTHMYSGAQVTAQATTPHTPPAPYPQLSHECVLQDSQMATKHEARVHIQDF